jgi:hypothetical protein
LNFQLQPQLFFHGVKDGNAVGAFGGERAACGPLEVEVPRTFELSGINDIVIQITASHLTQVFRDAGRGQVVAGNYDVWLRCLVSWATPAAPPTRLSLRLTSGVSRPTRGLQFGPTLADGQDVAGHRPRITMDHEPEAVRQQRL